MDRVSFIPEYSDSYELIFILYFIGEVIILMLLISGMNRSLLTFVIGLVLGFLSYQYLVLDIREIIFFNDHFTIINKGSRIKELRYSDIADIGSSRISLKKGHISLFGIKNAQELQNILQQLIDEEIIDSTKLTNNLLRQGKFAEWVQLFIPIGIIILSINFYFFPFENSIFSKFGWREDITTYFFAFLFALSGGLYLKYRNEKRRE